MKELANFFFLQFVYYFVITWNFRVIAQGHYLSIAISDMGIAAVNFTLVRKIASAESNMARAGYILGGAAGSLIATYLTKNIYGA
jgi:hypothetical protein